MNLLWFSRPGLISISLTALWILSPLAGQAALRILDTRVITGLTVPVPWDVSNTTDSPMFSPGPQCNATIEETATVGLMIDYSTAMLFGSRTFGNPPISREDGILFQDLNGNPLLPMPGIVGGFDMPYGSQQINVSSFVGVTIKGATLKVDSDLSDYPGDVFTGPFNAAVDDIASQSADITFPVSLFEINCTSSSTYPISSEWTNFLGPDSMYTNVSELLPPNKTGAGFFLDTASQANITLQRPRILTFGSFYQNDVILWPCSVGLITRDLTMGCSGYETGMPFWCFWSSVGNVSRRTLDSPLNDEEIASRMFKVWSLVDQSSLSSSSITERYLANGTLGLDSWVADLSKVDNYTFSKRLTTALNTFWML